MLVFFIVVVDCHRLVKLRTVCMGCDTVTPARDSNFKVCFIIYKDTLHKTF